MFKTLSTTSHRIVRVCNLLYRLRVALLIAALFLLFPGRGNTQGFHQTPLSSLTPGKFYRAAEKQGRTDFPDVRETKGTVVCITFDFRNADVTLATTREYGDTKMRVFGPKLTAALGRPDTDFLTFATTRSTALDMEMNDYLQKPSRNETTFTLDLYRLRELLEQSDLPKPLGFAVDTSEATGAALLVGGTEERALPLSGVQFLNLSDITPGTTLRLTVRVGLTAYLFGAGLLSMMGFSLLTPWLSLRKRRQQRMEQQPAHETMSDPPDPEEVQKVYNRMPPMWILSAGFPLLVGAILFTGGMKQAMLGITALLPSGVLLGGMAGMVLLLLGSFAASRLVERALDRREGKTPEPPNPDQPPTWTQIGYLYPMMVGMVILPTFLFIPRLALLPGSTRRLIVLSTIGLVFASAVLIGWLGYRRTRQRLTPSAPWYDEVMTMAKAANVRVRHVQVVTSPSVNAFANIFGTVGLTSALLRKMEPEEVRVIVAHEIGHHRNGHPRRQFLLSLIVVFGLIGIWWVLTDYLDRNFRLPAEAKALMNSPLFAIFILPLLRGLLMGRDQRKQEEMADRFAVEVTGDPDLVIHTLTKIHTLDATPHELKPSDEIISSHPSLKNRIVAIRRAFPTTDSAAPSPSETGPLNEDKGTEKLPA